MSYHTAAVVDAGAVPLLVALLSNPMEELSDQAAWVRTIKCVVRARAPLTRVCGACTHGYLWLDTR